MQCSVRWQCPRALFYVRLYSYPVDFNSKVCVLVNIVRLPYNLSHRTMVLYPVPRPGDMIGRGLVRKTGLIKDVGP
jgi:hypothetical protein